jgi:hypothetical protein
MIEVSFKHTAERVIEGQRHLRRQGFARSSRYDKWAIVPLVIVVAYLGFSSGHWIVSCLLIGILLSLLTPSFLSEWRTRKSFSQSPLANQVVIHRFDESGLLTTLEQSEHKFAWSAFTRAVEFSDGFLLFTGPQVFYWIPTNAFVDPNQISDFKNLLGAEIEEYVTIEEVNGKPV